MKVKEIIESTIHYLITDNGDTYIRYTAGLWKRTREGIREPETLITDSKEIRSLELIFLNWKLKK